MQVKDQAKKAIDFCNGSGRKRGGKFPKRKPNAYSVALKYILALRDMTYQEVADRFNFAPQNFNYIVNRMSEEKFNCVFVDKLCQNLNIDALYFMDLVNEINILMEKK